MNRFGTSLYNTMLPDVINSYTNGHKKSFKLSLDQFDKNGTFNIDYRLTADPVIKDGLMDVSFLFDIGAMENACSRKAVDSSTKFQSYGDKFT